MRINQNISAKNTHASMVKADNSISKSLERLSSGLRINRSADDAAGLAISEKMRGQISGLNQASRNAQDGISLLQTAEGALNETHSILQRMRELSVQAANDTLTGSDRAEIQKEMDQLTKETDRIAKSTEFNTKSLLRGITASMTASGTTLTGGAVGVAATGTITFANVPQVGDTVTANGNTYDFIAGASNGLHVHVGATVEDSISNLVTALGGDTNITATASGNTVTIAAVATGVGGNAYTLGVNAQTASSQTLTMHIGANAGQSMSISLSNVDAGSLGIGRDALGVATVAGADAVQGLDVTTQTAANASITSIDAAIQTVSQERSRLGAFQNRLEHTISNLGTTSENMSASESRVRDVDMAEEMANFSRSQILMQASTAMMAQANQKPQAVLKLLG